MNKKEYAEGLYRHLQWLVKVNEIGDPWGGNLYDEEDEDGNFSEDVLSDFFCLFTEDLYDEDTELPEWLFMYEQIYSWQFQSIHEGVLTYYANFYDVDREDGIRRLSDCLHRYGYGKLAKWYDYGIFNYKVYPNDDYPAEQCIRTGEVDEWIEENREIIWHVYVELLQGHKEEVLEAAANWKQKDKKEEKVNMETTSVQQEEEILFPCILQLDTAGSMHWDFLTGELGASQINDKMVSQMAASKEIGRIQTREASFSLQFSRPNKPLLLTPARK